MRRLALIVNHDCLPCPSEQTNWHMRNACSLKSDWYLGTNPND